MTFKHTFKLKRSTRNIRFHFRKQNQKHRMVNLQYCPFVAIFHLMLRNYEIIVHFIGKFLTHFQCI